MAFVAFQWSRQGGGVLFLPELTDNWPNTAPRKHWRCVSAHGYALPPKLFAGISVIVVLLTGQQGVAAGMAKLLSQTSMNTPIRVNVLLDCAACASVAKIVCVKEARETIFVIGPSLVHSVCQQSHCCCQWSQCCSRCVESYEYLAIASETYIHVSLWSSKVNKNLITTLLSTMVCIFVTQKYIWWPYGLGYVQHRIMKKLSAN